MMFLPHTTHHQQTNDVDASIPSLATRIRDTQTNQESQEPHRSSEQQRGDLGVAESFDDGREEVLEGLSEERDVLEEDEDVQAVVFESEHETVFDGYRRGSVGLFGIINEAPLCEVALFFTQPFGCRGEVGEKDTNER
jgi:hypothetical protein